MAKKATGLQTVSALHISVNSIFPIFHWHFLCLLCFRVKSKVSFPVVRGIWWVFRYHLGTVAFGSCIIAIIQLIRTILAYIQNKLVIIILATVVAGTI